MIPLCWFCYDFRNWRHFFWEIGDGGFTPIPVFSGSLQLLLPLIYRSQYPFKSIHSQFTFKFMYASLLRLSRGTLVFLGLLALLDYLTISNTGKSPYLITFKVFQHDVQDDKWSICYQLLFFFSPIQTQGFHNKQSQSKYDCLHFCLILKIKSSSSSLVNNLIFIEVGDTFEFDDSGPF